MATEARLKCYVSDESIYLYYFGDFEIGKKYHSPFRRDPRPSFLISEHNGQLLWKDFGLSEKVRPDAIGFVTKLRGVSRKEAVRIIWGDFLEKGVSVTRQARSLNIGLPYDLTYREISDSEMVFWTRHCIDRDLLSRFSVKAVDRLYRHGSLVWESTSKEPAYVYLFDKDVFKIYRPLSDDRFRGQGNGDIIEGFKQLPQTGRRLIVTSSMKDSLVLTSLGYAACAPAGETNIRAVLSKARELNARFSEVLILLDNDVPGLKAAQKLSALTGWRAFSLPKGTSKDPADVVKKYGNRFVLSEMLRKLAP